MATFERLPSTDCRHIQTVIRAAFGQVNQIGYEIALTFADSQMGHELFR
jgi:hypothetical protein